MGADWRDTEPERQLLAHVLMRPHWLTPPPPPPPFFLTRRVGLTYLVPAFPPPQLQSSRVCRRAYTIVRSNACDVHRLSWWVGLPNYARSPFLCHVFSFKHMQSHYRGRCIEGGGGGGGLTADNFHNCISVPPTGVSHHNEAGVVVRRYKRNDRRFIRPV